VVEDGVAVGQAMTASRGSPGLTQTRS
jgi:hypothetical protein